MKPSGFTFMPNDEEKNDLNTEEDVEEEETSEDETEETSDTSGDGHDQPSTPDYQKLYEEEKTARTKAEEERENYRKGLLSQKAKERSLDGDEPEVKEKPKESPEPKNDIEVHVRSVLYKDNERRVLRQVIDSTSSKDRKSVV